ncbi:transglycosylase SLT domain-containing protein [Rhodobium gokarnense]|uniref:Soluble lytic murein transglycosylase n=1 Tax=Rhodobium gokarnense TaxID=364296 RepID=A0ABT3HG23_9HYPH|nr:transglycosylase SLT domain-containing protein [Rhodobium gokarnense]MCW2309351.1 soluble lytic murein transglycosylase [Rhodobium gokarnense]
MTAGRHRRAVAVLLLAGLVALPLGATVRAGTFPKVEIAPPGAASLIRISVPRPKPARDPIAATIADTVPLKAPVPQPKPTPPAISHSPAPAPPPATETALPLAATVGQNAADRVAAAKGSLKDGLAALRKGRVGTAIAIHNGMGRNSLNRKILEWQIARSGGREVPSAFITRFAASAPGWPDSRLLKIRAEAALLRENPAPAKVIGVFGRAWPVSTDGTIALARAHRELGRRDDARRLIRDVWRRKRMSKKQQATILREFGRLLNRADHKARADAMLYHDRVTEAERLAGHLSSSERALVKARGAVIRRQRNAGTLLKKVPKSLQRDPSYLYARAQYLRRKDHWTEAGTLLAGAPRDPQALIDPDAWWVERKIVSRKLLELGKPDLAYKVAARHSAESPAKRAEAEFHAGWYALRFLKKPGLARPHFKKILEIGETPITRSRGYYWLGRAEEDLGNKDAAKTAFERAAAYPSAFYGQLARARLGKSSLGLGHPPAASADDRTAFSRNELVRAIKAMADAGHVDLTLPLFMHLSRTLPNAAQAALLTDLAEDYGKHRYALIVGKEAANRWPEAAAIAFPMKAIPAKTKITRGVEKPLVYAVARQESAFDPGAVSHAGARGLLQLLPSTAKATARRNGLPYSKSRLTQDAAYNATLGAAHLGELVGRFDGSYIMTFAGYNAGSRRVDEWVSRFGDPRSSKVDAIDWIERIPFTETRNYVQRITENLQVYRTRLNGSGLQIEKDLRRGG